MNRSIMMRKYGLDEAQAYVEQSTLLEPNNFIPSWVSHPLPTIRISCPNHLNIIGSGGRGEEGSV
jgi:hypothetical protein